MQVPDLGFSKRRINGVVSEAILQTRRQRAGTTYRKSVHFDDTVLELTIRYPTGTGFLAGIGSWTLTYRQGRTEIWRIQHRNGAPGGPETSGALPRTLGPSLWTDILALVPKTK